MRRRNMSTIGLAAATAAAVAGGIFLVRGDRYRLWRNPQAAHCWSALETLALSSSSLRPVSITVRPDGNGPGTRVDIEYRLDNALAGAVLEAYCLYDGDQARARAVVIGGTPVEEEMLQRLNSDRG